MNKWSALLEDVKKEVERGKLYLSTCIDWVELQECLMIRFKLGRDYVTKHSINSACSYLW